MLCKYAYVYLSSQGVFSLRYAIMLISQPVGLGPGQFRNVTSTRQTNNTGLQNIGAPPQCGTSRAILARGLQQLTACTPIKFIACVRIGGHEAFPELLYGQDADHFA